MDDWAISREGETTAVRGLTEVGAQARRLWPLVAAVYAPALTGLAVLVAASKATDRPVAYFTRDPAAELGAEVYVGVVSNIGIVLWAATASICLFAAYMVREQRRLARFLAFSGTITAILLIDDLFLLHEDVIPNQLGIHQGVVLVGYVGMFSLYAVGFVRYIAASDYLLLLVAIGFFGLSLAVDVVIEEDFTIDVLGRGFQGQHLIEDGAKFLGIVGWATYFTRESARSALAPASEPRSS